MSEPPPSQSTPPESESPRPESAAPRRRDRASDRYARLEERRRASFLAAVVRRFQDVEGGDQATLLSVTLFTTMLPLIILGFAYVNGFAGGLSPGILFDREVGLHGSAARAVRDAFGSSDALRSSWSVIGLAGFLLAGIPLTVTVAQIFAKAWLRAPFDLRQRLWRGIVWFLLYLVTLAVRDRIAYGGEHPVGVRLALWVASLVPVWVFWTLTPALLVRDGARGARFLVRAGLAGVVVNGIVATVLLRLVFPPMLASWTAFGPMGVAMAIVTWCGVIAVGWVATACVGAVLWERSAPVDTVLDDEPAAGAAEPAADPASQP